MLKTPEILQQAKQSYEEKPLGFLDEITTVSSNPELDDDCLCFRDILRQRFESNRRPRPEGYRLFSDIHLDSLVRLR